MTVSKNAASDDESSQVWVIEMQDPKPENIVGEKRVVHTVEHRVDWGYLSLGLGALVVGYVLYRIFVDGSEDATEDDEGVFTDV